MKSLLKRVLRALFLPLVKKIDDRFRWLVETTVRPLVVAELKQRIRPALDATTTAVRENLDRTENVVEYLRRTAQENTLLLDSLVRELVRVQRQLEILEQLVQDQTPDGNDPADPFALEERSAQERVMIG